MVYTRETVGRGVLAHKACELIGYTPYAWQLDAAVAVLCGKDIILDVGTGAGKTMCFLLPLLVNRSDIGLTISPLTALMLEQAQKAKITTVAICEETLAEAKAKGLNLYEDVASGKYQQVLVSPEIAVSTEFHKTVLSRPSFIEHLRVVNVDEAHCISVWGGSFRPDYADLGTIRARFLKHIPFMIASATMPDHVLDEIRSKLSISINAETVSITNARPNVALSVRFMKHPDESKGDLRFLIPPQATKPEDIKVTLVYCNKRKATEDACDQARDWATTCGIDTESIAFYHALIGRDRKRDIEQRLALGNIRILFCTDAVGMGCDMRNIARVVLWGLPPTFCAFVQRAGRAGRDLSTLGEAILIVAPTVIDNEGLDSSSKTLEDAVVSGEALDSEISEAQLAISMQALDEEGVRVTVDESEDEGTTGKGKSTKQKPKKKKAGSKDPSTNIKEVNALLDFVQTKQCRRLIWNAFFRNEQKQQLSFGVNTSYRPLEGERCCDNCTPRLFEVEVISIHKTPGLKRGKKKEMVNDTHKLVAMRLEEWRDEVLIPAFFGTTTLVSSGTVMSDDIITRLSECGDEIDTYAKLRRHALWGVGHSNDTNGPNEWGEKLIQVLKDANKEAKDILEYEEAHWQEHDQNIEQGFEVVTPADFGGEEVTTEVEVTESYRVNLQKDYNIITSADFEDSD